MDIRWRILIGWAEESWVKPVVKESPAEEIDALQSDRGGEWTGQRRNTRSRRRPGKRTWRWRSWRRKKKKKPRLDGEKEKKALKGSLWRWDWIELNGRMPFYYIVVFLFSFSYLILSTLFHSSFFFFFSSIRISAIPRHSSLSESWRWWGTNLLFPPLLAPSYIVIARHFQSLIFADTAVSINSKGFQV